MKRIRWTNDMVESRLREVAAHFGRMPSTSELRDAGMNSLAIQVSRRGGFREWARRLSLPLKDSCTKRGQDVEIAVTRWLQAQGFAVERQTARAPFDLLVNGTVRVDVKSAKFGVYANNSSGGVTAGYVFGLSKKEPTCDLYLLCGVDESNAVEWRYFVPASEARVTTITITPNGKYSRFREAVDVLREMAGACCADKAVG